MQARNFTTNVPKILDLKLSSEQIFSRKLSLGAPVLSHSSFTTFCKSSGIFENEPSNIWSHLSSDNGPNITLTKERERNSTT